MRAGKLRHRIAVDEAVVSQDEFGAEVVTWVERTKAWGSIEPMGGAEAARLGLHILSDVDTRIELRWAPTISGLNPRWRLRFRGVIYNIVSAANVRMLNEKFDIMCKSGVNAG